jgi:hypothetical protein
MTTDVRRPPKSRRRRALRQEDRRGSPSASAAFSISAVTILRCCPNCSSDISGPLFGRLLNAHKRPAAPRVRVRWMPLSILVSAISLPQ